MCLKIGILKYIVSMCAKLGQIQGGVAEGQPRFDKGGVAIIFYTLKFKISLLEFLR